MRSGSLRMMFNASVLLLLCRSSSTIASFMYRLDGVVRLPPPAPGIAERNRLSTRLWRQGSGVNCHARPLTPPTFPKNQL